MFPTDLHCLHDAKVWNYMNFSMVRVYVDKGWGKSYRLTPLKLQSKITSSPPSYLPWEIFTGWCLLVHHRQTNISVLVRILDQQIGRQSIAGGAKVKTLVTMQTHTNTHSRTHNLKTSVHNWIPYLRCVSEHKSQRLKQKSWKICQTHVVKMQKD